MIDCVALDRGEPRYQRCRKRFLQREHWRKDVRVSGVSNKPQRNVRSASSRLWHNAPCHLLERLRATMAAKPLRDERR